MYFERVAASWTLLRSIKHCFNASILASEAPVAHALLQYIRRQLEPQDWAPLLRVLNMIKASVPADASPGEVFSVIEEALRAHYATMPVTPAVELAAGQPIKSAPGL